MNKSIYRQEKDLFEELSIARPEYKDEIVEDGLCCADISNREPTASDEYYPENLWKDSNRRVLFLLKESNNNAGEDYKDWEWSKGNDEFGNTIASWLYGLHQVSNLEFVAEHDMPSRMEIFKKYPFAIVNVKKTSGHSSSNWNILREYAEKDQDFLHRQIRDILKPNIIVCGGSNDKNDDNRKMLSIAMGIIYPDFTFDTITDNNWCYYNRDHRLLLLDSYHPSYNANKVNPMLMAANEFLKIYPKFFD